jgi:glycosyltransferase involved in cell wall biosynthesis
MPSYRRGARIEKTLESVLRQTRLPDEILVVNDGGFAETREFVQGRFPSVQVIDVEHGGAALARNRGAETAKSDWLVFFDDDDEMLPHAVETLERLLETFPEAKAGYTDHTFENLVTGEKWDNHHFTLKNFQRMWNVKPVKTEKNCRLYDRRLFKAMLHGNLLQQPWIVERKTFLEVGGFFAAKASDDWDLYLRVTRSYPVALSDDVISHHFLEKDRPHLTLEQGQEDAQKIVIARLLKQTPWYEFSTRFILWRRLALFQKAAGDRIRPESLRKAWGHYLRSFLFYPFDVAVAARTLWWPLRMCWPR